MGAYRIDLLRHDGRLRRSMILECVDDDAAIQSAARIDHVFGVEVVQGERLVWRFGPAFRPDPRRST